MREPFIPRCQHSDESVHCFFNRRFGNRVAEYLASSLVHGIYAADATQLSMRYAFPAIWNAEQEHGSVLMGMTRVNKELLQQLRNEKKSLNTLYPNLSTKIENASIYAFRNGMSTLSNKIVDALKKSSNVQILVEDKALEVSFNSGQLNTLLSSGKELKSNRVILATSTPVVANLLMLNDSLTEELKTVPYRTVAVVNLAYSKTKLLPVNGFGYLVPAFVDSPVIGVIFDSDAIPDQDLVPQTRLTVMINDLQWERRYGDELLDAQQARILQVAEECIFESLGIHDSPETTQVNVQRACIPQFPVGYRDTLQEVHSTLHNQYDGRVSVLGASWQGVSINDCIMNARSVADKIGQQLRVTGLEDRI